MPTLEASREAILSALGSHPQMVFVRPFGNFGDEFIWAGTRRLLRDHIYREISVDELALEHGELAVISGGGAWSREYNEYMPEALAIAEQRFDRVVVLPSSFDCSVDRVRRALTTTSAIVFARERESFAQIRDLCDARLAHDCAFFSDLPSSPERGTGTLNAFRTDAERRGSGASVAGNRDLSETAESLDDWLAQIAAHEVINTDRAHVMIAAARMGRRVNYGSNSYFKVDALATSCLAGYDVHPIAPTGEPRAESETHPMVTICEGPVTHDVDTPYVISVAPGERILPDTLSALVDALKAEPRAIAATPAFVDAEGETIHCGGWPLVSASDFHVEKSVDRGGEPAPTGWAPPTGTLFRSDAVPVPSGEFTDPACAAADWVMKLRDAGRPAILRVPRAGIEIARVDAIPLNDSLPSRAPRAARIASHALLFARHDLLLPDQLTELLPELRTGEGDFDAGRARLLLAAVRGKGALWMLTEWMNGGLTPLLEADSLDHDLREHIAWLEQRNDMLTGIEGGGWWRLRERLAPILRLGRR